MSLSGSPWFGSAGRSCQHPRKYTAQNLDLTKMSQNKFWKQGHVYRQSLSDALFNKFGLAEASYTIQTFAVCADSVTTVWCGK